MEPNHWAAKDRTSEVRVCGESRDIRASQARVMVAALCDLRAKTSKTHHSYVGQRNRAEEPSEHGVRTDNKDARILVSVPTT